jgi:cation diffusion facilitator CzcD-associated flavoprotein CzcO
VIEHVDVIIVGAGISGIDAGYHVQTALPAMSYAILEGRDTLGGTWDLFRYPGIRSDSDMYTLGFPFRPWTGANTIADGESILAYVRETAEAYGIDRKIRYRHRVERARWSSEEVRWVLDVRAGGELRQLACSFLFLCSGYYDYQNGYTPEFTGRERFKGRIVHPQFWTEDIDYAGKRVVVIGSGATAVTLVPAMAERAAHVTMLQRSPTYIISVPARDPIAGWMRRRLPARTAASAIRWKNVLIGAGFYQFCRRFPEQAKRLLVGGVKRQLGDAVDVEAHFTPAYKPWDQRLCLIPDADLFTAIKAGRVSVVTDHVDTFTETGIKLRSGQELPADLIVTATGLSLRVQGGIQLEVDGARVDPAGTMLYKGMMCTGVPNFAFAVGYTNASWTLKCDLTSQYVVRLLAHMQQHGYTRVTPQRDPAVEEMPLIDFSSGYVQRSIDRFPRQGKVVPWRLYQNYARDLLMIRRGPIEDPALELRRDSRRWASVPA